jgi:DNA polymerase
VAAGTARHVFLQDLADAVRTCTRCRLHEGRTHAVPGEGPLNPSIFFVGEGPGREEDVQGRPFVGSAGKVLDGLLADAGVARSEVFITSVVKCRPPGNRNPKADEMAACRPYLLRQIELVQPRVIVTLGHSGLRGLLGVRGTLSELRTRRFEYEGIPVRPSYHPAAVLYNRRLRDRLLEDIRAAKRQASGGKGRD